MKRRIALCLLLAALAFSLSAQTTIKPATQMAGEAISPGTVFVVLPNGTFTQALLGAGLVLDLPTGSQPKPILRVTAVAPASPIEVVGEALTSLPATPLVYNLANPPLGAVKVYRNGIRQKPTLDYSIAGQVITFVAYYASSTGDAVQADYWRAAP